MANLFNNFVFEPILSLLIWTYKNLSFGDLGLAIIFITVFVRLILLPLFYKSSKDQSLIRKLQPQVNEIRKKYKNDKEKQGRELMDLYRAHKLNPFSGFLFLLIQLPIFIALFKIFRNPELIAQTFSNITFLGIINLTEVNTTLVIIAVALQYLQGKIALVVGKKNKVAESGNPVVKTGNLMFYIVPVFSFVILIQLPAALALYWIASALFSTGQQLVINKKIEKVGILESNNGKHKTVSGNGKDE